jgi:hypothetical protein
MNEKTLRGWERGPGGKEQIVRGCLLGWPGQASNILSGTDGRAFALTSWTH